jgi:hypothetical protein
MLSHLLLPSRVAPLVQLNKNTTHIWKVVYHGPVVCCVPLSKGYLRNFDVFRVTSTGGFRLGFSGVRQTEGDRSGLQ